MRNVLSSLETPGKSHSDCNPNAMKRYLLGLLLCLVASSLVAAAPSNLDPTFGVLGKVISSPDGSESIIAYESALQPDGKIVFVGNRVQSSQAAGIVVARYNSNGSLDTNFGNQGLSTVTFGTMSETAVTLDIQPDGKIVIGATLRNIVNNVPFYEIGLARFNADGSLDLTFDGDGKTTLDFNDMLGVFYFEYASVVKVASDGKIVVGGIALDSGVANRFILARFNSNGALDSTFGTNGKVADEPWSSNRDNINDLIVLPDGKIVVAGHRITFTGGYRTAIKYTSGGVKEWTYLEGRQINVPYDGESLNGIAALPDGKFIVVGKRQEKIVALRLNADGTPDNTFQSPAAMPQGEALAVAAQADGKIVASLAGGNFSLVRFNPNGSLDTAFGLGGFTSTEVSGGQDYGNKVYIQPDGKYLVSGYSSLASPTRYYFSMVRYLGSSAVAFNPLFDYDGDGRADVSVFRPAENQWYVLRSGDFGITQRIFGAAGDILAPADYDGDDKTDFALYRPSTGDWWYQSSISNAQINVRWGAAGDIPRPSDFDGDGKSDFVVYRQSTSVWYRLGTTGETSIVAFGIAEDKPLTGDFDGDNKSDLAVYRPSTGTWWYALSSAGNQFRAVQWGLPTDLPVPADYDGDGKTDFAVYRPSAGGWYILNSADGSISIQGFGLADDKPVAADYDGDGKADIAVFRPSTGTWYLQQTTSGFGAIQLGSSADIPTENAFVP